MTGGLLARWRALGTTAEVVVTRPASLAAAREAVEERLAAIDAACSRFREDSELTRLNVAAGTPFALSPLLTEALGVALRAAALTDGLVDPTVGRALVLAGYDRDFSPEMAARRHPVMRVPGWRTVSLDSARARVTIPRGVSLDLGATAKALAADQAARAAARRVRGGVLVSLGGDIAVGGSPPEGGWTVLVGDDHRGGGAQQRVSIHGGGLATSSTTVRRWGADAHHLIDPGTGVPAASPWRTASVAAGSCVDANIASTAAILLGERAPAWLAARRLPGRLVGQMGEVVRVGDWPGEPEEVAA